MQEVSTNVDLLVLQCHSMLTKEFLCYYIIMTTFTKSPNMSIDYRRTKFNWESVFKHYIKRPCRLMPAVRFLDLWPTRRSNSKS